MNKILLVVFILLISGIIIYISPINSFQKSIIYLFILLSFIIIDYNIIKNYKIVLKINEIIQLINNNDDIDLINDKINNINKNREKTIKKIIKLLILNKKTELSNIMNNNLQHEIHINKENVKNHINIYKSELKEYKEYLKIYFNNLNEANDINIIIINN